MHNSQDSTQDPTFSNTSSIINLNNTLIEQLEDDPDINQIINRYTINPELFNMSATRMLCSQKLKEKQAEKLTNIAIGRSPESCASLAFHAINTRNENKIITKILAKASQALNIIIVDDEKIMIEGTETPIEDTLINWLLFWAKSDDLCTQALQNFLNLNPEISIQERKLELLNHAIINQNIKATERLLHFLNPEEDNILALLDKPIENDNLAHLIYAAITTPYEEILISKIQAEHKAILDIQIKEMSLIQWILFSVEEETICQAMLQIYTSNIPNSTNKLNELLIFALTHKSTITMKHLLKFYSFNINDETLTNAVNTEIWEKLRQVCASFQTLIERSKDEEILGWSSLDIEALIPKSPIKNLIKLAAPISLLIYHGFTPPPDLCELFKNLKDAAKTRNNQSLSDWTEDNPINELEAVENKFKLITELDEISKNLQRLTISNCYPDLTSEKVVKILTQLRQALAKELFKTLNSLAQIIPGNDKVTDFEMPDINLDKTSFHEIITPFLEKTIISYHDWSIIRDLLHLIKLEDVAPELSHRKYSGPSPETWNNAPDQQKYLRAIQDEDHIYHFYALPLLETTQEATEETNIKKIELALLTSLFYHLNKNTWDAPICIELKKLIHSLDPSLPESKEKKFFEAKYSELEADEYYAECPSEDSEDENIHAFSKEPIGIRNALLTFAERMMTYGQVDNIWTKERNKLRDPVGTHKSVNFYDVTTRAEIHHEGTPPTSVQNDLSLLNEHALTGILSPATLKEIKTKFVIAQYRGIHYNTSAWSQKKRKQARKDEKTQTVYSPAVFKKANISTSDDITTIQEKIQHSAQLLHHQLTCLNHTGAIKSQLSSDGYLFEEAAYAIQDFYTKNYDGHERKRKKIKALKDQHQPITKATDVALLFSSGPENYNNSTGDTPYHACRYAYGLKEYGSGKGKRLRPRWRSNGKAERPYSGETLTFLFDLETYLALAPHHLVSLDHKRHVSIDALKIAERETAFAAYIPGEHIVEHKVARYPNFDKPYQSYYQHKYGMDKALYEQFQKDLFASKPHSEENKRIKLLIGEHLCAYQEACLIEDARQEAKRSDKWLIYRDRTGGFSFVPPPLKPANRGASAEAGSATRARQEALMERRKNLNLGWLEKKLQQDHVIPGNNYREVLETLCPRIKEHSNTASTNIVASEAWIKHFKEDIRPSMRDHVKTEFQNTLNSLLQIAENYALSIIIESFLFEEDHPILLNSSATEKIRLLYLGGDGFHGLVDKRLLSPIESTNITPVTTTAINTKDDTDDKDHDDSRSTSTPFRTTAVLNQTTSSERNAGFKRKRAPATPNLLSFFKKDDSPQPPPAEKRPRLEAEESSHTPKLD